MLEVQIPPAQTNQYDTSAGTLASSLMGRETLTADSAKAPRVRVRDLLLAGRRTGRDRQHGPERAAWTRGARQPCAPTEGACVGHGQPSECASFPYILRQPQCADLFRVRIVVWESEDWLRANAKPLAESGGAFLVLRSVVQD